MEIPALSSSSILVYLRFCYRRILHNISYLPILGDITTIVNSWFFLRSETVKHNSATFTLYNTFSLYCTRVSVHPLLSNHLSMMFKATISMCRVLIIAMTIFCTCAWKTPLDLFRYGTNWLVICNHTMLVFVQFQWCSNNYILKCFTIASEAISWWKRGIDVQ